MPVTTPVKSPKASVVEFITRSVEKMKLKGMILVETHIGYRSFLYHGQVLVVTQ